MADRVGFEPTVLLLAHTLSKRAHSTTLTPVHFPERGGNLSALIRLGNANFARKLEPLLYQHFLEYFDLRLLKFP